MLNCSGVYIIFNFYNNNFYIGSSFDLNKRVSNHKKLLKKNKNPCTYLQRAFNKYGESYFYFAVLEFCKKEECLNREQFYMNLMSPKYNVCPLAKNSSGRIRTKKAIINHFESQRKFTDEEVIKMFDLYNRGVSVSEIAKLINCKPNNVSCILNKPRKYELVKLKYKLYLKNKKIKYNGYFKVTYPNGESAIIKNLSRFAKENNLCAGNLNKCANGIYLKYKGFSVEKYRELLK